MEKVVHLFETFKAIFYFNFLGKERLFLEGPTDQPPLSPVSAPVARRPPAYVRRP
jgi:hypothetical protein